MSVTKSPGDIWIGPRHDYGKAKRHPLEEPMQMHITDKGKRMLAVVTAWETFQAAVDSVPGGWELLGEWFDEDAPAPAGTAGLLTEIAEAEADGRMVPGYLDPNVVTWDVLLPHLSTGHLRQTEPEVGPYGRGTQLIGFITCEYKSDADGLAAAVHR